MTTQWIYDITQEFVYQFQGFCQLRCQVANHSPEVLTVLEASRDAWAFPAVESILRRLTKFYKPNSNPSTKGSSAGENSGSVKSQFGYFATVELGRLYCLLGDYNESINSLAPIKLFDRSELFAQLTLCHFNVFYHNGVCKMMLGQFAEAAEIFAEITSLISRILKPGAAAANRQTNASSLQKMLDKVLALIAIVVTLEPNHRVEDNVIEMTENKWSEKEKLRKLQAGDEAVFTEFFVFSTPKFVSAVIPDYSSAVSIHQEAAQQQLTVFLSLVKQQAPFYKLRSFLTLYASIDIAKLARFNDISEEDLVRFLLHSYYHSLL